MNKEIDRKQYHVPDTIGVGLIINRLTVEDYGVVLYRNRETDSQTRRTGVAMIPVPVTASSNDYSNNAFDNDYLDPCNDYNQPSAPPAAASAVGDDNHYETLSDDTCPEFPPPYERITPPLYKYIYNAEH